MARLIAVLLGLAAVICGVTWYLARDAAEAPPPVAGEVHDRTPETRTGQAADEVGPRTGPSGVDADAGERKRPETIPASELRAAAEMLATLRQEIAKTTEALQEAKRLCAEADRATEALLKEHGALLREKERLTRELNRIIHRQSGYRKP
jgi:hypothetical protein